jgi:hypothetical protein
VELAAAGGGEADAEGAEEGRDGDGLGVYIYM